MIVHRVQQCSFVLNENAHNKNVPSILECRGATLQSLCRAIDNSTKLHFPPKSPERSLMVHGYVGHIIIGIKPGADSYSRAWLLHIGNQVLSPWASQYRVMHCDLDWAINGDMRVTLPCRFTVHGTNAFYTSYKCFHHVLDFNLNLYLGFYKVLDSSSYMVELKPNVQQAMMMFGGQLTSVFSHTIADADTSCLDRLGDSLCHHEEPSDGEVDPPEDDDQSEDPPEEDDDQSGAPSSSHASVHSDSEDSSGSSADDAGSDFDPVLAVKSEALYVFNLPPHIGEGSIVVYKNGEIYALCHEFGHSRRCRKSRSHNGNKRKPQQGRPLGYLMAFLMCGDEHVCGSSHKSLCKTMSFADREYARAVLASLPDSQPLFCYERDKLDDESDEPFRCP